MFPLPGLHPPKTPVVGPGQSLLETLTRFVGLTISAGELRTGAKISISCWPGTMQDDRASETLLATAARASLLQEFTSVSLFIVE